MYGPSHGFPGLFFSLFHKVATEKPFQIGNCRDLHKILEGNLPAQKFLRFLYEPGEEARAQGQVKAQVHAAMQIFSLFPAGFCQKFPKLGNAAPASCSILPAGDIPNVRMSVPNPGLEPAFFLQ